jgi:hypothetical protein
MIYIFDCNCHICLYVNKISERRLTQLQAYIISTDRNPGREKEVTRGRKEKRLRKRALVKKFKDSVSITDTGIRTELIQCESFLKI